VVACCSVTPAFPLRNVACLAGPGIRPGQAITKFMSALVGHNGPAFRQDHYFLKVTYPTRLNSRMLPLLIPLAKFGFFRLTAKWGWSRRSAVVVEASHQRCWGKVSLKHDGTDGTACTDGTAICTCVTVSHLYQYLSLTKHNSLANGTTRKAYTQMWVLLSRHVFIVSPICHKTGCPICIGCPFCPVMF